MSGLTAVPPGGFQGSGMQYTKYGECVFGTWVGMWDVDVVFVAPPFSCVNARLDAGFEYWANPSNRGEGFITWQTAGQPSVRMGAGAVAPDQGTGGSGVGQRLIPEEPMSIVLNLGISGAWVRLS